MSYCPFSSSDHDTIGLYRDRQGIGAGLGKTRPSLRAGASGSARTSGSERVTWRSNARDMARSARDMVLYRNTIFESRQGGRVREHDAVTQIIGLRLQDIKSIVGMAMTIEREIEYARSTWNAGASGKKNESQSSSSLGKKQKASSSCGFQSHDHLG